MQTWLRWLAIASFWLAAPVLAFYALDYVLNAFRSQRLPKNFSVVKSGVLYRSGQMRPEHFREVLTWYGIRTILCLNGGEQTFERRIADELGASYREYQMPGSGQGPPEAFHEIVTIMADPARRPVLVHCNAGAYRTGASVALYRMLLDGWQLDDAVDEMRYSGFAGQQDLIDHIRKTFDSLSPSLRARLEGREPFETPSESAQQPRRAEQPRSAQNPTRAAKAFTR